MAQRTLTESLRSEALPRASVILPAYHSSATLEACLNALKGQTYSDFEIILVNSSQEQETARVVEAFPEVTLFQSDCRLLPHEARNLGAEHATGDVLVFSDPDCSAEPRWLEHLLCGLKEGGGAAVAGGSMGLSTSHWLGTGIHLTKFHWLLPGLPSGRRWILPTANVAYPRAVWEAVGPFDGRLFSGDAMLSWRARNQGFPLLFDSRAVVLHQHTETLRAFCKQRVGRGREFFHARLLFENWSRLGATAYLVSTPLLGLLVTARAGRDAVHAGWAARYLLTLPIQLLGQLGWAIGEAAAAWAYVTTRARPGSPRGVPAAATD